MKRFGLALVMAALLATAAFGAEFGRLSIDVADGWTASQEGSTVIIVKDDKSSSMSVSLDSMGGNSLEAIAAALSQQLGGGEPQLMSDGPFAGDYAFEFQTNGVNSECLVSGDGTDFIAVVVTAPENAGDDLTAMFTSIKVN